MHKKSSAAHLKTAGGTVDSGGEVHIHDSEVLTSCTIGHHSETGRGCSQQETGKI